MNRLCGLRSEKSAYIQPKGSGYENPQLHKKAQQPQMPSRSLSNIPQMSRQRNDIMNDKSIKKIAPADSRISGLFG